MEFQPKQEVKGPSHGRWEFIQWPSANQNTTNFLEVELRDLPHTEVSISHEAKLSGIYEIEVTQNNCFYSKGVVVMMLFSLWIFFSGMH